MKRVKQLFGKLRRRVISIIQEALLPLNLELKKIESQIDDLEGKIIKLENTSNLLTAKQSENIDKHERLQQIIKEIQQEMLERGTDLSNIGSNLILVQNVVQQIIEKLEQNDILCTAINAYVVQIQDIAQQMVGKLEQNDILCTAINSYVVQIQDIAQQMVGKLEQNDIICTATKYNVDKSQNAIIELIQKQEKNDLLCTEINNNILYLDTRIFKEFARTELSIKTLTSYGEELINNANSIFSYCINEALKRQINVEETSIWNYYKSLHELTQCHTLKTADMKQCRVGRHNDGGYVMFRPYSKTKIAYSIGICDDISWDKKMAEEGYEIYQYDHTIESLPEENPAFHWKKIGLTGLEETDELKHLDTLILENGHQDMEEMVLKMDVEGYEWDFLITCDQRILNKFSQIIIEAHGFNNLLNAEKIIKALRKLKTTHSVVHLHGNNYRYTSFYGNLITPDVVELTLVKNDLIFDGEKNQNLIQMIDEVNRPNSQDIWIGRW